jgi:hypothetical protein
VPRGFPYLSLEATINPSARHGNFPWSASQTGFAVPKFVYCHKAAFVATLGAENMNLL